MSPHSILTSKRRPRLPQDGAPVEHAEAVELAVAERVEIKAEPRGSSIRTILRWQN